MPADLPPGFEPITPPNLPAGFEPIGGAGGSSVPPPAKADSGKIDLGRMGRILALSPPAFAEEVPRGFIQELRGKESAQTLPSSLGATLAQLVRGGVEGVGSIIGGAEKGGEALAGRGDYRPGDIAPPETANTLAALAGVKGFGLSAPLEVGSEGQTIAQIASNLPQTAKDVAGKVTDAAKSLRASPEQQALRVEDKAARKVSKALSGGAAPAGQDIASELTKARGAGQPLTLSDIESPDVKNLVGNIYRQGGAAAKRISDFFKGRNAGATERVEGMINDQLSDGSLRQTAKQLADQRSTNARPLWDEAMAGGSMAPLERQFESQFAESTRAVTQAQQRAIEANARVTQATGRQATGGNVYSDSAANAARREANESLTAAKRDLEKAQADREALRERLRKAQADGTANAPGATWSPRLQEFLDQPEVKQGLARGYAIERRRAVGQGQPFNPREYAVVGEDAAGEPIVGEVPNMRLLAVAKEGLDSIIESDSMKDPLTGRPNKTGLSYIKLRDGFENELDRLNPAYKAARDQWAGDSRAMRALEDGRNIFNDKRFTLEEVPEHLASLNPSERQFFILGVADKLKSQLLRKVDAGDKGAIINTEDARRRITPLFGSEEAAEKFLADLERERVMKQTPTKVTGGSPTAERVAADRAAMMHVGQHLLHGHPLRAATRAAALLAERVAKQFGARNQAELNEVIARIMTDPNVVLRLREGMPTQVVPPSIQYRIAPPPQ